MAETNFTHWPFAAGEMAARIRAHAWHRSPLGAVSRWSPHLRTATDLMLGTPLPTLIFSGSDGVVLYNDALVPFLGARHPAFLGAALSTAGNDTAARFRALAIAVNEGETVLTDDNWLSLSEESEGRALTRLACVPLHSPRGEIIGIWAQMIAQAGLRAEAQSQSAPMSLPTSLAAIDISARMRAEANLKDSERWTRMLMEAIPQVVWRSRADGQWTWASPQWTELTGQPQTQSYGLGWLDMVHPADREEVRGIWNRVSWQQIFEANYRLWHIGENRYRTFKSRATPLRDDGGQIREWVGTSTDIEDLEQLHGRTRVLLAELQHRTRNLLALVRSIGAQTIGNSDGDVRKKYADFNERLAALSRAQSLITRAETERVDLESLLRAELAALRGIGDAMIRTRGPTVALPPVHAQTLALVVHELATNAMKHGALGTPGGQLDVSWNTLQDEVTGRTLHLEWREAGVKIVPEHQPRRGFGRELIEEALQFSLDARTELRFGVDGIVCSIALPLANVRQPAAV